MFSIQETYNKLIKVRRAHTITGLIIGLVFGALLGTGFLVGLFAGIATALLIWCIYSEEIDAYRKIHFLKKGKRYGLF